MIGSNHSLTPGYVARHVRRGSRVGIDIAVLDIAQDFLLAHFEERRVFGGLVVFKGGTALRKLFAGSDGRFSTDIDLAAAEPDMDREVISDLVAAESDVELGPFRFSPSKSRDRWRIRVSSPLGAPPVSIKLDVGPPCWLQPDNRQFVSNPTQQRYGFDLPALPTMRLEEILAEKIARLSRTATARDASDLVWAATTAPHSGFSRDLVRRVAILKVWVDNFGLRPAWNRAISPTPYDPKIWLSPRDSWDDEQIGLLVHPPPPLNQLEADLRACFSWMGEMSVEEAQWAKTDPNDRDAVIHALQGLKYGALSDAHLW